jgi:hypothetical protein
MSTYVDWLWRTILFVVSLWVSVWVSLMGGLMFLVALDELGLASAIDRTFGSAVGILFVPTCTLLAGLFCSTRAIRSVKFRTAARSVSGGIVVGSLVAIIFLFAGGWSGIFE